ncbi:MAG: RdgB/HAM1 family non-canonical purine NTP pyrophosphatase [Clostridiales bacterium]|nr:RdgB/HAM1 family non-canonical purine NTP pyrophosphatase [Clostridiales bacterium]
MRTAILASQNRNKIKEIRAILEKYGLEVISRDDAGIPKDDIEETGTTFEENSYLKASVIMDMIDADPSLSRYAHSPVIADDSGLMVDALGGEPGVFSARYAGEDGNYDNNNTKLLAALEGVPFDERTAKFVTVITLIYPDGEGAPEAASEQDGRHVLIARGECTGHIALTKMGSGGFGYDPVFIPDGYENSFAQLGTDFKNTISHRAHALAELERLLG